MQQQPPEHAAQALREHDGAPLVDRNALQPRKLEALRRPPHAGVPRQPQALPLRRARLEVRALCTAGQPVASS